MRKMVSMEFWCFSFSLVLTTGVAENTHSRLMSQINHEINGMECERNDPIYESIPHTVCNRHRNNFYKLSNCHKIAIANETNANSRVILES